MTTRINLVKISDIRFTVTMKLNENCYKNLNEILTDPDNEFLLQGFEHQGFTFPLSTEEKITDVFVKSDQKRMTDKFIAKIIRKRPDVFIIKPEYGFDDWIHYIKRRIRPASATMKWHDAVNRMEVDIRSTDGISGRGGWEDTIIMMEVN